MLLTMSLHKKSAFIIINKPTTTSWPMSQNRNFSNAVDGFVATKPTEHESANKLDPELRKEFIKQHEHLMEREQKPHTGLLRQPAYLYVFPIHQVIVLS